MTETTNIQTNESQSQLLRQIAEDSAAAAKSARSQLLISKIRLAITALILVVVIWAVGSWGPRLQQTAERADQLMGSLSAVTAELNRADIPALVEGIDQLAQQGTAGMSALEDAAEVLEKIDIEKLNQAISDLQTAISPLARLFG